MVTSKSLASLGCAVALLAGTAGAFAQTPMTEAELDELIAAAQAEGRIVIYAGQAENTLQRYLDGFEAAYGIPGEYIRASGNTLTQRFSAEVASGAPQADIVGTSEASWFDDNPEYFVDLSASNLPNVVAWPEDSRTNARVVQTRGIIGLLYNTELVAEDEVPRAWPDVLDPKWRGNILISDPQNSANYAAWVKMVNDILGQDYLETLAGQDIQVVASGATGAQQVAAGSKALNFPTQNSFAYALQGEGAPVDYSFMTNPILMSTFNYGIAASAPRPNAARLFMNWLLSGDGIVATCTDNVTTSPGDPDGAHGCMITPEGETFDLVYGTPTSELEPLYDILNIK